MSARALKMRARRDRASGLSAQMLEINRARISSFSHSVVAVASATLRVLPMRGRCYLLGFWPERRLVTSHNVNVPSRGTCGDGCNNSASLSESEND